ncbi:MAG: hypothetical protein Q9196_004321 [Gyalolechia fulgens]
MGSRAVAQKIHALCLGVRMMIARSTAQKSGSIPENSATVTVTAEPIKGKTATITSSPTIQSPSAGPASSTSKIQNTDQPSASVIAPPTAENGKSGGSSSPQKTPIIIGVVLGVVIASLGIWLIWHYMKRKTKSSMEETKKDGREGWPPGQEPPSSGNGLGLYGGSIAAFNERPIGTFLEFITEQLRVVPRGRLVATFGDVRSVISQA